MISQPRNKAIFMPTRAGGQELPECDCPSGQCKGHTAEATGKPNREIGKIVRQDESDDSTDETK